LVAPVVPGSGIADPALAAPTAPSLAPSAARAPEVREQAPQIARARAIAVTKTAPTHRLQPGDRICGSCGEGNAPTRKFCSRCGDALTEAAVIAKVPWWRRIRIRRGPKVVRLGTEHGRTATGSRVKAPGFDIRHLVSQIYRKGRVLVAAAVVAAGVIYGIYPPFRIEVDSLFHAGKAKVSDIIPVKPVPITPISCTGNAVASHPASNVCDGYYNNYWEASFSPSAEPTVTMKFQHPVTLTSIIVFNGAYGAYNQNGRPSFLQLTYSNHETDTVPLQDTSQQQPITIKHGVLITSVQFRVISIYPGQVNSSDVAISQIELYGIQ
jgi:hypothetical protein